MAHVPRIYLREYGRLADLSREGYATGLALIKGNGRQSTTFRTAWILISRSQGKNQGPTTI
jgi:hypothetical protein